MRAHSATSTDAGNYLSGVLLSLSMMLNLELPHVNVLSKCDMLPQYGSMERAPKEEGKEGGGMGGMGGMGGGAGSALPGTHGESLGREGRKGVVRGLTFANRRHSSRPHDPHASVNKRDGSTHHPAHATHIAGGNGELRIRPIARCV